MDQKLTLSFGIANPLPDDTLLILANRDLTNADFFSLGMALLREAATGGSPTTTVTRAPRAVKTATAKRPRKYKRPRKGLKYGVKIPRFWKNGVGPTEVQSALTKYGHLLEPVEHKLLNLRYGLSGNKAHSTKQVAQSLGLTMYEYHKLGKKVFDKIGLVRGRPGEVQ